MIILYILKILTMAALVTLTIIIYRQNKRLWENRIFALILGALFIWVLTSFFVDISSDHESVLFWSRLALFGPAFLPSLFLHLSYLLPYRRTLPRYYYFIFYLPSLIIALHAPFSVNVRDVFGENFYHIVTGPLYYYLLAYYAIYLTWAFFNFSYNYKNSSGKNKLQLFYLILAMGLSFPLGIAFNLIFLMRGDARYSSYGFISALLFALIVFYAVARHRLMGIRFLATRIYTYLAVACISFLAFHLVCPFGRSIENFSSASYIVIGGVFSLAFSFIVVNLIKVLQVSGDYIFYKGKNPKRVIKDFIIDFKDAVSLDDFYNIIRKDLAKILATEEVGVKILSPRPLIKSVETIKGLSCGRLKISADSLAFKELLKTRKMVVRDELSGRNPAREELDQKKIKVVMPLLHNEYIVGVLLLGRKKSNHAYSKEDVEFLEIIGPYIASSVIRICRFEQTKKQNEELLKLQTDFSELASREIQTPLTMITKLLKPANLAKMTDQEKNDLLSSISTRTERLTETVNDYMTITELEDDDFVFETVPTDIEKLVREVIEDKTDTAKKEGLKLELKVTGEIPKVNSNRAYLKQALINLLNNAIQFTPREGRVEVELSEEQEKSKLSKVISKITADEEIVEKNVVIRIKDTGVGIEAKDIPHLFEKFNRSSNASYYNAQGTGLGLYIVKKVMDSHKSGKVYVESSEVGKGTVMVVKLAV